MKKKEFLLIFLAVIFVISSISMFLFVKKRQATKIKQNNTSQNTQETIKNETKEMGLVTGVYDPSGQFNSIKDGIAIEQVFLPWRLDDTTEIKKAMTEIQAKNRSPYITVEPWPFNYNGMTKETLFSDVTTGKYDSSIQDMCGAISETRSLSGEMYITWGPEMELKKRPWQQENPKAFVSAYKHFVDICRPLLPSNVKFIWGPAGNKELKNYWPGDEYVDYIGISIYAFKEYDIKTSGKERIFDEVFKEKYGNVYEYKKPIFAREFGAAEDKAYQTKFVGDLKELWSYYPYFKGIIYFNDKDPDEWLDSGKKPDWRIETALLLS
jgi:beta-mannanase